MEQSEYEDLEEPFEEVNNSDQPNISDNFEEQPEQTSNKDTGFGDTKFNNNLDRLRRQNRELQDENKQLKTYIQAVESRLKEVVPNHPLPLTKEILKQPVSAFLDEALVKKSYIEFKKDVTLKENVYF